jgi:hypothetical protein
LHCAAAVVCQKGKLTLGTPTVSSVPLRTLTAPQNNWRLSMFESGLKLFDFTLLALYGRL